MQKSHKNKLTSGQWAAIGAISAALIGAIALIIAELMPEPVVPLPPTPTGTVTPVPSFTPRPTPTLTFTPSPTPQTGKPVPAGETFSVLQAYDPSGYMGDVGDISIAKHEEGIQFTYETRGMGPTEWDWKYKDCLPNPVAARFSGVMLLDPPNNWGVESSGGYDLRGFSSLTWEARSLSGEVYVEFLIGGVSWHWVQNEKTKCWEKVPVPYPDTLPRISLGAKRLTDQTQTFQFDLSGLPPDYLQKVVGAFGWTISWGDNGVELDPAASPPAPLQARKIIIEVDHVRYEK